ncbi:MAG: hypothetical protein BZY81_01160 [SAR202 cluster bacterium Io17-Chloro-G4]|nr:MAG: hypothetical protein BZY81_01160 [SAR202 cluster bacterium Io17-Chloro-G4]
MSDQDQDESLNNQNDGFDASLQGAPPFAALLGIYEGISADGVGTARMPIREYHLQDRGYVQGGLIVTLADYSYYLAVKSLLSPGQITVTVELKVNFLAGAREGELTATAKVVSGGRRIFVVEGDVSDDKGVIVARGLSTYLVSETRQ